MYALLMWVVVHRWAAIGFSITAPTATTIGTIEPYPGLGSMGGDDLSRG